MLYLLERITNIITELNQQVQSAIECLKLLLPYLRELNVAVTLNSDRKSSIPRTVRYSMTL